MSKTKKNEVVAKSCAEHRRREWLDGLAFADAIGADVPDECFKECEFCGESVDECVCVTTDFE